MKDKNCCLKMKKIGECSRCGEDLYASIDTYELIWRRGLRKFLSEDVIKWIQGEDKEYLFCLECKCEFEKLLEGFVSISKKSKKDSLE